MRTAFAVIYEKERKVIMNKKWTIFSLCAIAAAVVITAIAELTAPEDEDAKEEI